MPDADVRVTADLTFLVDVPAPARRRSWRSLSPRALGARSTHPTRCTGRVRADGHEITVELEPLPSLGGGSSRPLVRPLANHLDRNGLTVHIVGPHGPLIRLGASARAPWWQLPATHGSRIELVSLRALARSLRGPRIFEMALPPAAVLPTVTEAQRSTRRRVAVAARQVLRRVSGRRRR